MALRCSPLWSSRIRSGVAARLSAEISSIPSSFQGTGEGGSLCSPDVVLHQAHRYYGPLRLLTTPSRPSLPLIATRCSSCSNTPPGLSCCPTFLSPRATPATPEGPPKHVRTASGDIGLPLLTTGSAPSLALSRLHLGSLTLRPTGLLPAHDWFCRGTWRSGSPLTPPPSYRSARTSLRTGLSPASNMVCMTYKVLQSYISRRGIGWSGAQSGGQPVRKGIGNDDSLRFHFVGTVLESAS